jgi:hypothetical protein
MHTWVSTLFAGGFGYPFATGMISPGRVLAGAGGSIAGLCAGVGTALVAALAVLGIRKRTVWLALYAVMPLMLYVVKGIRTPPHYFIISIPAALLLAGAGLERVRDWSLPALGTTRGRVAAALPGVLILLCGSLLWGVTLGVLERNGGSGGDYGLAYRWQREAARFLSAEGVAPADLEAGRTRDHSIGIHYLLRYVYPPASPDGAKKAVLIDTLRLPGETCGSGEGHMPRRFGPLLVCVHEG